MILSEYKREKELDKVDRSHRPPSQVRPQNKERQIPKMKTRNKLFISAGLLLCLLAGILLLFHFTAFRSIDPDDFKDKPEIRELLLPFNEAPLEEKSEIMSSLGIFYDERLVDVFGVAANMRENYLKRLSNSALEYFENKIGPALTHKLDYDFIYSLLDYIGDKIRPNDVFYEEIRLSAVYMLSRYRCPESVLILTHALRDESPRVRSAASESLSIIRDKKSLPCLLKALSLETDPDASNSIAGNIAQFKDETTIKPIADKLFALDTDFYVNDYIFQNFDPDIAYAELFPHLSDPNPKSRRIAAEMLGSLNCEASEKTILKLLEDADPQIRIISARALTDRHANYFPVILERIEKEKDSDARISMLNYLMERPFSSWNSDKLEQIFADSSSDSKPEMRIVSAKIGLFANGKALEILSRLINDGDDEVREAAVQALGTLRKKDAIDLLVNAYRTSSNSGLKSKIIAAIANYRDAKAVDAITEFYSEPSSPSKAGNYEFESAFIKLKNRKLLELFLKAIPGRSAWDHNLAQALQEFGDKKTADAVLEIYHSSAIWSESRSSMLGTLAGLNYARIGELITESLKSPDRNEIISSLRLLTGIKCPESISLIVPMLSSEDIEKAICAALALLAQGWPDARTEAYKVVVRSMNSDVYEIDDLIYKLGENPDARFFEIVKTVLNSKTVPLELKMEMFYFLADTQDQEHVELLKSFLSSPEPELRCAVLEAMSVSENPSLLGLFIREYEQASDREIKFAAMDGITSISTEESLNYCRKAALAEKDRDCLTSIAQLLADRGNESDIGTIIRLLSDADDIWQGNLIIALSKMNCKEAIPEIRKLKISTSMSVRGLALRSLCQLGDEEAIKEMISDLNGDDYRRLLNAVETLQDLKADRQSEKLISLLDYDYGELSISAVRALGRQGDPNAVPALIDLLDSDFKDKSLSSAAIAELGKTKDGRAVPRLIRCLDEPQSEIRASAVRALRELAFPEGLDAIKKLKEKERFFSVLDEIERQK